MLSEGRYHLLFCAQNGHRKLSGGCPLYAIGLSRRNEP
jgi:hypothetical protein